MTPSEFVEARQMLCLAALSYRGFEGLLHRTVHVERLQRALERGLHDFTGLCGPCQLAWGPVAYRAPFSLFDDAVMYAVRRGPEPHRYAVVVRGTNPVSAFDWLFGDFWVGAQVPWPYGGQSRARTARISFSSLLGLNILQIMQAPLPPSNPFGRLFRDVVERTSDVVDDVRTLLRPVAPQLAPQLREIRDDVLPLLAQLDTVRQARAPRNPTAHVLGLLDEWRSATRRHAFERVLDATRLVSEHGSFNALRFLEGGARVRAALERGVTLLAFLKAAVADADGEPVDVVVTGHSKGGALAPTLALWLADIQGSEVAPEFRWDESRTATVRCFSFAGPTAGNQAFAQHSNDVIGPRCHRIVNPLDVVPRAWEAAGLAAIPTLYDHARPIALLDDLVAEIGEDVGALGYTHIGNHVETLRAQEEDGLRDFFLQLVHQHLTGYLRAMELDELASTLDFFSPVA
jgi:hypothetical protein